MKSHRKNRRAIGYAFCTAMAAVMVSGCASSGHLAMAETANAATVKANGKLSKAVAKAERRVEKSPRDVSLRIDLANAYLQVGRFESAVTTYNDAQALGDENVRTALSLALAHIGAGQHEEAIVVLDQWRDSIPEGDLGLALALAGDTSRGVSILSDALRAGEDTPKLRQNLAYAYALDGRWREARLMAAQDVPADELDARISEWARQGRPEDYRMRVAGMLGVPLQDDAGQPAYLALSETPAEEPAMFADASETDAADDGGEMPIEEGESFWLAEATKQEVAPAPMEVVEAEVAAAPPAPPQVVPADPAPAHAPAANDFDLAFASPRPQFVSNPVVQKLPARPAKAAEPARKSRPVAQARALVPAVERGAKSTHLVQLGSYTSAKDAEQAWGVLVSRNPELAKFDKTVTQAVVHGKKYWRVAAAGFDKGTARSMCSAVKRRGGGCITYSASNPLPGTVK